MSEKFWYLKNCPLLERLAADELRRLESRCRARSFPRKGPIYLPVEESDTVYLLAAGQAKICQLTEEGKESILAFLQPGELFGELALFEPGAREEYVEAVEPSTVVLIPGQEMRRLLDEHADLALGITRLIGLRRRRLERRLKYLLFRSNRQRLSHLLLDLAEQFGRPAGAGITLNIKLAHQDLANLVGSTRETVTVVLGQLRAEGLIEAGRRKITLIDPQRLADSVHRRYDRPDSAIAASPNGRPSKPSADSPLSSQQVRTADGP